ncbi:unnamed protein product [Parascedosporium putredinis]|uniref:Clr5 domain-containing protein n=1 Tax=Parascedosporium putredinis TaxID=1442378 RepID=A0A9P1H656_9PEZI|nr:unnamed protein product [Parascedosporium putredinis]CAI7999968.1 unnamed protein product [Parascedosporium putredinis]
MPDDWERLKPTIIQYYYEGTCKEMRKRMKREHGFENQFEVTVPISRAGTFASTASTRNSECGLRALATSTISSPNPPTVSLRIAASPSSRVACTMGGTKGKPRKRPWARLLRGQHGPNHAVLSPLTERLLPRRNSLYRQSVMVLWGRKLLHRLHRGMASLASEDRTLSAAEDPSGAR